MFYKGKIISVFLIYELHFKHTLLFIRETFFLICLTPFQLLYHVK